MVEIEPVFIRSYVDCMHFYLFETIRGSLAFPISYDRMSPYTV